MRPRESKIPSSQSEWEDYGCLKVYAKGQGNNIYVIELLLILLRLGGKDIEILETAFAAVETADGYYSD